MSTTQLPPSAPVAGSRDGPATVPASGRSPSEGEQEGGPVVVGPIRRRAIDTVLVAVGALVTIVLIVAGCLLLWGNRFANDYVEDELSSQNIFFPDEAGLTEEGRTDLVKYAGEQVTTGQHAEAYASYIGGHLEEIADGATYADLGQPEREARAAVQAAVDEGAPQATIDELQATSDEISNQRQSLFRGETLRGLLLSTFAWSTIGRIAGIAAVVAFIAAAAMAVLVVLGMIHRQRMAA